MKTDRYTKVILTIIAVCLTVIVLQNMNLIQSAKAGNPNMVSLPVNANGTIDVNIESVDQYAFRYCTVPVEIQR